MIEIKKPQIVTEESKDGSFGRFTVEPLERGLGTTLGKRHKTYERDGCGDFNLDAGQRHRCSVNTMAPFHG